ncbi:hypothetical protein QBC34DRAFT_471626 [Podospora aff. communis PSN243]|uniref:Uncharacterized protein n=1 Tax=Podospora aff. communis PSN243 TaxID=3040156 RepID=A0AAV9GBD9_9PEZI|nr:hypothetical protein QBC34DRAFT_471626 [Podospora aff. communis PSN243]
MATAEKPPRSYGQFKAWYPQFGFIFDRILRQNCTQQHDIYLYGTEKNVSAAWDGGGGDYTRYIQPTIECLLDNANEYTKANLSMAQIMLGLMPTILAFIGASSLETSLIAVIGQRPLLATLLAFGSPPVYLARALEYPDREGTLTGRGSSRYRQLWGVSPTAFSRFTVRPLLVALEYLLAAGAIANLVHVKFLLITQAMFMLTPSFVHWPIAWAASGIGVHIMGALTLRLRARREGTTLHSPEQRASITSRVYYLVALEFSLLGKQDGVVPVRVRWFDQSALFLVAAWIHSLCCIAHLISSAPLFSQAPSSLVLEMASDSFFATYIASAVVCRAVLSFELAGLREGYHTDSEDMAAVEYTVSGKQRGD